MDLKQHKPGTIIAAPQGDRFIANIVTHQTSLNHAEIVARKILEAMANSNNYTLAHMREARPTVCVMLKIPYIPQEVENIQAALDTLVDGFEKLDKSGYKLTYGSSSEGNAPDQINLFIGFKGVHDIKQAKHIANYAQANKHTLLEFIRSDLFSLSSHYLQ